RAGEKPGRAGPVWGGAGRGGGWRGGDRWAPRGGEALACEPANGGNLVEERTRETRLIVAAMNAEPRLGIAPAGEQWQQRAGRLVGNNGVAHPALDLKKRRHRPVSGQRCFATLHRQAPPAPE